MKIEDYVAEISSRLNRLDFTALWPDLKRYEFALVDQDMVYFESGNVIPRDTRFMGNTAIKYEDSYLAIWQAEYAIEDLDRWTAQIVHEMVHANQYAKGESRFINDIAMLRYPRDLKNYEGKLKENMVLVDDSLTPMDRLSAIVNHRLERYENLGEYRKQEIGIETIEGLPEYIAIKALNRLDVDKAVAYRKSLQEALIKPKYHFDIRRQGYFFGALFLDLVFNTDIKLNYRFDERLTFFEQTACQVKPRKLPRKTIDLKKDFTAYQNHLEEILKSKSEPQAIKGKIIGYDPMNMVAIDDDIIMTSFVFLEDEEKRPQMLPGPLVVTMEDWESQSISEVYQLPEHTSLRADK